MTTNRTVIERAWKDLNPKVRHEYLAIKENVQFINGKAYTADGRDVDHLIEAVPKIKTPTYKQRGGLNAITELADHEKEHGGFVFAFFSAAKTMEEQFPDLAQSDLARLMFIGTYTAWETGQLKHDNGVPLDKKGLAKLLDISRPAFNKFYASLLAGGILSEEGGLYMNPALFYRGNLGDVRKQLGDVQYTRLFRKTVRELYAMYNGRTIKQLALIYAVLPFTNFNFNVICFNAEESNADLVRPMKLENLAAMLGYQDTQKLVTALRKIKYNGKSVFALVEADGDKRARKVIVNPAVVYAADGQSLDAIKILFR
ncbi:hypothetical protein MKZ02_21075 [Pseudobacillus sp. FSL P4-0506]|uniref:hypothetical protein n=1 Tax=Pseudobacillus sp. FSL P4-0506 TaxID=2921576 RepID=UPI0030F8F094